MRIALLAHGFPPEQSAGTETYTQRLAEGLRGRGHLVRVIVAAPDGRAPTTVRDDGTVLRITQGAPYAALRTAARDTVVEARVERALGDFAPDLVHVQHLQNLSVRVPTRAPMVWTLHDAWGWCAAGGLLLRQGTAAQKTASGLQAPGATVPCAGPGPDCAACASAWVRDPPFVGRAVDVAGRLARWVEPGTLHRAWRRLPAGVRDPLTRAPPGTVTPAHLAARDREIRAFAGRCSAILSPSRWLAEAAAAQGFRGVELLPHGVDPVALPRDPDGPFVFLGTLAPHKGPDLVVDAHARSGVRRGLAVYGPPGPDAGFAARFPAARSLGSAEVRAVLAGARALVLGSRWPENAPLVVLEARAQGCPVIAPRIGGLPELVEEGVDGLLVSPDDADALAAALRVLDDDAGHARLRVRVPPTFASHLDAVEAVYRRVRSGAVPS
jgi:glycosyltransferase involved in cell wall biosynthesis